MAFTETQQSLISSGQTLGRRGGGLELKQIVIFGTS